MSVYDSIFKRKSIRKYDMASLPQDQLAQIRAHADALKPLLPDLDVRYILAQEANISNMLPIKAPHYFVICAEHKAGYLENIGFMFQQMDLFLSDLGLGSCWLGMARPSKAIQTELPFIIILAFGKAQGNPYRLITEFARKPLSEISSGEDARLDCARLAPSATNSQNWFFACQNGHIHLYQRKLNLVQTRMYGKMNQIDMGIAACHLCVATEHMGREFVFDVLPEAPQQINGYTYTGTVR